MTITISFGRRFWITLTLLILLFTAFVVVRNLWHMWQTRRSIHALERQMEQYQQQIERDSLLIERLKYDDYLEEFAREQYQMQRRDEDVYIFAD